ncbi:MAG: ABC transporter permease [Nitrospirae bacterium]|nr:ABC transporter permease [Nitrospirota bacterium]
MVRLFAVIERDLRKFMRNPVVLAMSIVMPILYLVILGNSFQGKLKDLPIVVVNQDTGPYSNRIIENLRAIEAGPKTFTIISIKDQRNAIDRVREGRYKAAIIIPPDFSKRVSLKKKPSVGIFLDNTDSISAEAIRSAVNGALRFIEPDHVFIREKVDVVHPREIDLYSKVDYYQSLVPGVVIMAIFLGTLTTGAFNLVMDRFLGIDESYLLTPISKFHIVSGLAISSLLITTVLAALILTLSMVISGIPLSRGVSQCASIFIVVILTTLCLLSMMFVILGRVNHPRIVGILSGFLNVILFFPSGAVYPIASFPEWLKVFAKVNPEAYAVNALKSILFKDASLINISGDIAFLLVFSTAMMIIAIATFKRTF